MILEFPNIKIKDEEWVRIISDCLNGWTEESLSLNNGFCQETLKFYDGLIGTVIKHGEKLYSSMDESEKEIVDSWKYQGKLYRLMHECPHSKKRGKYILPKVIYHGMIAHWTSDYTFEWLKSEFGRDHKYIILEADTRERFAFDVNRFRENYGCRTPFTEKEREIIFPMYKENIKEYRMSINEFVAMKRTKKKNDTCKNVF